MFKNFLKLVVYITTLQLSCIAWIGMESCSKFLRNLVTTVRFNVFQFYIILTVFCEKLKVALLYFLNDEKTVAPSFSFKSTNKISLLHCISIF